MERKKGYIVVDNLQRLDKDVENIGGFCEGWYTDGEKEYLFKLEKDIAAYNELFYSILLRKIGLKTVEYDLAIKGKQKGVITPNYKANPCQSFTVADIFEECIPFQDERRYSYYLEKIVKTIQEFCKRRHFKYGGGSYKKIFLPNMPFRFY